MVGVLCAGLLTACGSSTTSPTSTAPPTTSAPTTSSTASPGSTGTTSGGAQNLVASDAVKADLTTTFVAAKQLQPADISSTEPGSVYYAVVPATGAYWALASFLPSATASQQVLVGMQDGGRTAIFTRSSGGSWTLVSLGSVPFCPSRTSLPADVIARWGLTDPSGCTTS